ncbi:MAG: transcriptional regulator [Alphaproteobacteria bacterium]
MNTNVAILDTTVVPTDARRRLEWVKYQLRLRGSSFAKIARAHKVTVTAIRNALYQPSARLEQAIAEELGIPVSDLFPERYGDSGERLIATKPRTEAA